MNGVEGGPARLLRTAYWVGIIVDAAAALGLALPGSRWRRLVFPAVDPGRIGFAVGARTAAPLMAGWSALLVWADRRPAERRGVLLLTAVPVVVGLMAAELADVRDGYASMARSTPTLGLQSALLALFLCAYRRAGATTRGGGRHAVRRIP